MRTWHPFDDPMGKKREWERKTALLFARRKEREAMKKLREEKQIPQVPVCLTNKNRKYFRARLANISADRVEG